MTLQCMVYQGRVARGAHIGKVWFELMADAEKVGAYRVRFDMVTHINSEKAQGVWCWFEGVIMHFDEVKLRV